MRTHSHGFTSIELMLTIIVAGLLVAYASVPIKNKADLEGAAKKLSMDVRYARDLALTTGSNCGVYHVNGTATYIVYKGNIATVVNDPLKQQPYAEDLKKFRGVNMINGFQFEFDSYGKPVVGSGTTANLSDGTNNRQVQVIANTGYVQIL